MRNPGQRSEDAFDTCPRCGSTARLPPDALGRPARCSSCGLQWFADYSRHPASSAGDHDSQDEYSLEPRAARPKVEWTWETERTSATTSDGRPNRPLDDDGENRYRGLAERNRPPLDPDKEIEKTLAIRYEADAPPEHPFTTRVFGFPWHVDVLPRWLAMSGLLALCGVGWITTLFYCGILGHDEGASINIVGGLILGVPTFFLSVFCLSYVSACGVAVIQDTASGCDTIHEWPSEVGDWFATVPITASAAVCSLLVGALAKNFTGGQWSVPACLAAALAFPFLLLSALEAGNPLPFSVPILKTLVRAPLAWVTVYVEIGVLATLWVTVTALIAADRPVWAAGLSAAPLAAILLIGARLLGRLAWFTSVATAHAEDIEDDETTGRDRR